MRKFFGPAIRKDATTGELLKDVAAIMVLGSCAAIVIGVLATLLLL